MDFGFTNDDSRIKAVCAFRDAAVADGWLVSPTYRNEPMESASSLSKNGFKMMVLSRVKEPQKSKWKYEAEISIWGPDGLAIKVPTIYDFEVIQKGLHHCNYCNKDNVETQRVSFAGRCCVECLPTQRKKSEYPGWDN